MERRRQWMKKKIMRWLVIAAIYMALICMAVTVVLGSVWVIKNTVFGIWLLIGSCLLVGGWLFLGMREEWQTKRRMDSRWDLVW